MQVTVIDANGGIGQELLPRLADAGHDPVGVVRDESQFEAVRDRGGGPRLSDPEGGFESTLDGVDAVVFTVGSGRSTGADKMLMVDLWGVRRVVGACVEAGTDRFVMISSIGAGNPPSGPKALCLYLVVKRCVDDYLEQSSLDTTTPRPTRLTDAEGTGSTLLTVENLDGDTPETPRADVAQAVVTSLDIDRTAGETLTLTDGDTTIGRVFRGDD